MKIRLFRLLILTTVLLFAFSSVTITRATDENEFSFVLNDDGKSYSVVGQNSINVYSITIPSVYKGLPVTHIGERAFSSSKNLSWVQIPNSIVSIGDMAFYWCTKLYTVSMGNSVTTIGDMAFCYCTSLSNLNIPESVTQIGKSAFSNCNNLQGFTYCGFEEQWEQISIDSGNDILINIYYHSDSDDDDICNLCEKHINVVGDVDGSEAVNNKDFGILQRYVNGWVVMIYKVVADVNGDGAINNKDLGVLQRYINDWPVELAS